MERLFFGYSSRPEDLRETLYLAATRAQEHSSVESAVSWEDLKVDGRLIINEIEAKIEDCTLGIFDLTTMNLNVLFELGLAIGMHKRVVILRDSQDKEAAKRWSDLSLLTTTGFTGYKNLGQLQAEITRILTSAGEALWDDLMRGVESTVSDSKLLYVPSLKEDNASQRLSRLIDRYTKFEAETLETEDYGNLPLAWYAEQLYSCRVAVFHLTPSRSYLAERLNPRASRLAGIARGLGKQVVIIAEKSENIEDLAVDYRDISIHYSNSAQLERQVDAWLEKLHQPVRRDLARVRRHLSTELASLRFGNHVAERDREGLDRYFVETRDYYDIINASAVIFTGKKGTGKTANMMQAAEELRADPRNLVCVIKPASYELEGLLEVLSRVHSKHLDEYLIEALWKYLIYTEMASSAVEQANARPAGIAKGSPLHSLQECLEQRHLGVDASFSVRLERLVISLEELLDEGVDPTSIAESRNQINSALYGRTLKELRTLLGAALTDRSQVAVLVDNLDKAWERGANLDLLARLLLGLLTGVGRIVDEFRRENSVKSRVNVNLTAFLRSDIFAYVRKRAREPDKIAVAEIEWRDRDLLARVLEDRFLAARPSSTSPEELWTEYFVPHVRGVSSREYVLSRVQARPRDLVFLANAAVARASNAKHKRVEEIDILEAEKLYSQFAFEALLVEGIASNIDLLESVLVEFAGEQAVIEADELNQILKASCSDSQARMMALEALRRLGFLGLETTISRFDYGGTDGEMRKAEVLARKLEKAAKRRARYEIHPAYRAFLEIRET